MNVTYEIVTPEIGDVAERGFICRGCTLREAISSILSTRTRHVGGIESIEAEPGSVTIINSMEYLTGAQESRTMHFPGYVTPSSLRRVLRLLAHHGERVK